MDTRVGPATVSEVLPLNAPNIAVIVVEPLLIPVANPDPLIVAKPVGDEIHATVLVKFWVLPSVYVPIAVNCTVVPDFIEGFAGVTVIETRAGGATVRVVDPVIEFKVAAIEVTPRDTPVARPWCPLVLLIVATPVADALQVTEAVRFWGLPLLNCPVATNCCEVPRGIEGFAGVTVIEARPVALPVPVSATVIGLPEAP
jgi:hypothetical protein